MTSPVSFPSRTLLSVGQFVGNKSEKLNVCSPGALAEGVHERVVDPAQSGRGASDLSRSIILTYVQPPVSVIEVGRLNA